MRHHLVITFRVEAHFANGETLAELHQLALSDDVARRWLLQEVDGEAGSDRKRHPSDVRENRHIYCAIGDPHQRRPGNRAAWPQVTFARGVTQTRALRPHRLDPHALARSIPALREFLGEPPFELRRAQFHPAHTCPVSRCFLALPFRYNGGKETQRLTHAGTGPCSP